MRHGDKQRQCICPFVYPQVRSQPAQDGTLAQARANRSWKILLLPLHLKHAWAESSRSALHAALQLRPLTLQLFAQKGEACKCLWGQLPNEQTPMGPLRSRMHARSVIGPNGSYDSTSCSPTWATSVPWLHCRSTRAHLASWHRLFDCVYVLDPVIVLVFLLYLSHPARVQSLALHAKLV